MWNKNAAVLAILFVLPALVVEAAGPDLVTVDAAVEEAEVLLGQGDAKAAVKAFKNASRQAETPSFRGTVGLARAFNHLGAFQDAEANAREALELAATDRDRAIAHNVLAMACYARGTADSEGLRRAEEALRTAIEIGDGEIKGSRFLLGLVLLKQERDDDGVAELRRFLEEAPKGPSAKRARELIEEPRRARENLVPSFEVVTLDGRYVTSEDLVGKVVLLDFWATWCAPCVAAIPHLRRLSRRAEKDPFVILSIANDSDEAALRAFVEKHQMTWLQHLDSERELIRDVFEVSGYPTYIVVDHQGLIVYRQSGWSDAIGADVNRHVGKAIKAAKKAGK